MEANFFQQAMAFSNQYGWRITMIPNNGNLIISALLYDPAAEGKAMKVMQTMNLEGTPQELDEGFFRAISAPVQKTVSLLTNEREYEKSLEEAKKQSKQEQAKNNRQKQPEQPKPVTFETEMEKVEELETQEKYNEALMALPKADKYPDHADEIEQKRTDLWELLDKKDNNLFS